MHISDWSIFYLSKPENGFEKFWEELVCWCFKMYSLSSLLVFAMYLLWPKSVFLTGKHADITKLLVDEALIWNSVETT